MFSIPASYDIYGIFPSIWSMVSCWSLDIYHAKLVVDIMRITNKVFKNISTLKV
jgi:hypothetical protein